MCALFFSLLFVAVFSYSMDSIDGQKWDGEFYDQYAYLQLDAGKKHVEKISFDGCHSVVDIGCGSGAITALIADKLPEACVIGSDISSDMIRAARKKYGSRENLSFLELDAERCVGFSSPCDMAVSFLALHWIQDKPAFFATLYKTLKPGGRFYLTVGTKNPEIEALKKKFFGALFAQNPQWNFLIQASIVTAQNAVSLDEFTQMATTAGFVDLEIEEQIEHHSFANTQDFANFIATFISGYKDIAELPEQKRKEFITTAAEFWTNVCADGKPSYRWANLVAKGKKPCQV